MRIVAEPNDVWCIDFKGWFRARGGELCDPLTISDAHSRFLLACLIAIVPPRTEHGGSAARRVFQRHYGGPFAIRSDNGAPFAERGRSVASVGGLGRGLIVFDMDTDGGMGDGSEEVPCELVVAGGDASVVFEFVEEPLDQVALA